MDAYIQANAYFIFAIVMIAAALLHWGQKVRKGEATGKFVDYWITETPGYSLGTLGALVGAWWLVLTTKGLDGMVSHMIIEGAFATGWAINSAVSPGSAAAKAANDAKNAAAGFIRLSMLPWLAVVSVVLLMTGCAAVQGVFSPLHTPQTDEQAAAETPQQKALRLAHAALDEANAALVALNTTIGDNVTNQVWGRNEAQDYLDQSKTFGKKLDAAREALRIGNFTDAQQQAEALRTLIILLQKKAAERANQSQAIEPIYT